MSWYLDLVEQVIGRLSIRNGGTGNALGLARGVVLPCLNAQTAMVLGNVVRWRLGTPSPDNRIVLTTTAAEATVLGVVVGYFTGSDLDRLKVADPPLNSIVAVQIVGMCDVLLDSGDCATGDYAVASSTDGYAAASSTPVTGAFGRFLATSTYGSAKIALLGSTVVT